MPGARLPMCLALESYINVRKCSYLGSGHLQELAPSGESYQHQTSRVPGLGAFQK